MQRWGEEDVKTADYQILILCQGRRWLNMKIVIIVHTKAHTNDNDNRYKSMHWTRETFSNFSLPILIAVARSDCLLPILFHCSQHSLNPPIGIIAMEKDTKFPRRLWLTAAFLPIVLFRLRSAFSQLSFAIVIWKRFTIVTIVFQLSCLTIAFSDSYEATQLKKDPEFPPLCQSFNSWQFPLSLSRSPGRLLQSSG